MVFLLRKHHDDKHVIQSATVQISTLTHQSRLSRHVLYLCYKECRPSAARVRWENYIRWYAENSLPFNSPFHSTRKPHCAMQKKVTSERYEVFDLDFSIHAGSMPKLSFKMRTVTLELIMLNSRIHFFLITWPSVSLSSRARGEKKMNALQCARYVYKTEGIRGFYRGLTASYAGISETMICFLIYETLKKYLAQSRFTTPATDTEKRASDFLGVMFAAAFAKGCASCIAYPHGRLILPISQSV